MYDFPLISSVKPCQDYKLYVVFDNGERRLYDVKPLFAKWPAFQRLKDRKLFLSVQNDRFGIVWNEDIDLASDELYHNGLKM